MLIAKDLKGKIYVAKVAEPKDRYTPGQVGGWYFVGPGTDVFISWMSGTKYLLVFKYLASNFARVMDASVWPPLQVDPVTSYNPITIQRPESWIPSPQDSNYIDGLMDRPADLVKVIREDPYIRYDANKGTYTVTVKRDPDTTPPDVEKYKLYQRNIGDTQWVVAQDWKPEITGHVHTTTKKPDLEFQMSWGNLWADGYQNYPRGSYPYEHYKGPILRIEGSKESVVINLELEEVVGLPRGGEMGQIGLFTPMPEILFCSFDDQFRASIAHNLGWGYFDGVQDLTKFDGLSDTITMPSQFLFSSSSMGF